MFVIIAAIGKNRELGKGNKLIWHLPGDLKYFKERTSFKTILMGKNTFDSLPKVLPNRKHVVLSYEKFECDNPNVEIYTDLNEILAKYKDIEDEVYVSGGASMYKLFLNMCEKMYLTEIDAEEEDADVYFPEFDKTKWNKKIIQQGSDNGIDYTMVEYYK